MHILYVNVLLSIFQFHLHKCVTTLSAGLSALTCLTCCEFVAFTCLIESCNIDFTLEGGGREKAAENWGILESGLCDQKLFQRRMSLLPASQTGLAPPNGEWPCCLSAARERKTPLFPWAEAPGEGGRGLACVYSLSWPGKHRRGRSVSAVAASPRGLWETSVWRAGGAPAVSGVDNELQVLQWVV